MVSLVPVALAVFIAALVVAVMLAAPHFLAPRRDTAVKSMPYESGMDPVGDARRRFDVRFYLVAIVFLLFDVELLFLYPWAVSAWSEAGLQSPEAMGSTNSTLVFAEILVFMGLLGLAYVYAWRRGVFNWK
jgi:NADH-quinone oxidoreductase subunit A